MNKDNVVKLLKSTNKEDFLLGLSFLQHTQFIDYKEDFKLGNNGADLPDSFFTISSPNTTIYKFYKSGDFYIHWIGEHCYIHNNNRGSQYKYIDL